MRELLRTKVFASVALALTLAIAGPGAASAPAIAQGFKVTGEHSTPPENSASGETPAQDTGDVTAPGVEIVVAPEEPVIFASAGEAHFRVLLRNNSERTLPEGSIELSVGPRITSGSVATGPTPTVGGTTEGGRATEGGAGGAADGGGAGGNSAGSTGGATGAAVSGRFVISTSSVGTLATGSKNEVRLNVPVSEMTAQALSTHGVYALYATYQPSDSGAAPDLTAFAPIVWEGPESTTADMKLTVVVPLVLPGAVQTLPSAEELAAATPRWDALVDYALRAHAVLAIDPRIITAIRAYGTAGPEGAAEFLDRLEHTTLTSFLLQYGDADPVAQAALGSDALMQPVGFDFATRLGTWPSAKPAETDPQGKKQAADATDSGSGSGSGSGSEQQSDTAAGDNPEGKAESKAPGATGDEDAKEQGAKEKDTSVKDEAGTPPTTAELEAWPQGIHGAWPAPGQVTGAAQSLLRANGTDFTVLRSDNVSRSGGPRAKFDGKNALITDHELDAGVALAYSGATRTERRLGSAQAAARIVLAAEQGITGIAVGADRGGVAEANSPAEVLTTLAAPKWVTLTSLADQPEGTATLRDVTPDADRVELLGTAVANETEVLKARAVLVDPQYLDEYQRLRLLNLFATRYAAADADFPQVAADFAKGDAELRNGVRIVGASHAQLVGASSNIPIQLRNSLPFDALVTLTAAPTSAALSLEKREFPRITIPSDSTERAMVPARSRVSSGESALALSVTSVDGAFTASTGRLELSIATRAETVVIAALAFSVVFLLSVGIWRSVLRRRKGLATGAIPTIPTTPVEPPSGTGERE